MEAAMKVCRALSGALVAGILTVSPSPMHLTLSHDGHQGALKWNTVHHDGSAACVREQVSALDHYEYLWEKKEVRLCQNIY